MAQKIYNIIRKIVNYIYNLKRKSYVLDELLRDSRDYGGWGLEYRQLHELPAVFDIMEDSIFHNQNLDWNYSACWSYWTIQWVNAMYYVKWSEINYTPKKLWNKMIEKKLGGTWGSYWIDNIKLAKEEWYIDLYYYTDTLLDILNAIYRHNWVVSGSQKIWRTATKNSNWEVKELGTYDWHFFTIIGWDKNKIIWDYSPWAIKCKNSFWDSWGDWGYFWIPFDIVAETLFNTRYALVINFDWDEIPEDKRRERWEEMKGLYI